MDLDNYLTIMMILFKLKRNSDSETKTQPLRKIKETLSPELKKKSNCNIIS
jgi:hypothetical protein